MSKKKKVIVGLSGGVDSAVTALLLKERGYDVTGIFMQNWEVENDDPHCRAEQDLSDARAVCDHLDIPFETINFAKDYWNHVFQYCLDEFAAGRTPNPDVWCNREIKFKVFLKHALALGADALATGHYATIKENQGHYQMLKGKDPTKDQSYFLYMLGQYELQHSLFPLADIEKTDVRNTAKQAGLLNFSKKDSTGICFIGERKFKTFLSEFLLAQPGPMQTPEGKSMGQHDGLMFYTLGQRKGLNIGGQKEGDASAWYVLGKEIKNNLLIVGQGHNHPLLYSQELTCSQLHWVSGSAPENSFTAHAKIRYRQTDQACHIMRIEDDLYKVIFDKPQRAITPGQSVVFYNKEICLGGGIIN